MGKGRKRGRQGKRWEYEAKKIIKQDFGTSQVKKLMNYEHLDFMVFYLADDPSVPAIALIEAKTTTKPTYYLMDEQKKRAQWQAYFDTKAALEELGFNRVGVWLYLKKPEGVFKIYIESADKLPTSI